MTEELNSDAEAKGNFVGRLSNVTARLTNGVVGRGDGFSGYRFNKADGIALQQVAGVNCGIADEISDFVRRASGRTIGSFPSIGQLHTKLGRRATFDPSPRLAEVLRDYFIDRVNRRLQKEIYHKHFSDCPPPRHASHDQRLSSLESTYPEAQAIVDSYDWEWLAGWLQLARIGEDGKTCVQRLSNFAFRVRRVNFRFTYHCNIACRHCYNNSGPDLSAQRIPLDLMLGVVAQMPEAGICNLNLTGGEPFLYPDHLTALIAAARVAGLRGTSIYTNGFWATTAARAERMLERLWNAGFMLGQEDHIKVSTGVYHQEFIAIDRVLTLARAYFGLFGRRLRVDVEEAPESAGLAEKVRQLASTAGLAEKIDLFVRSVSALGRGKDIDGIQMHSIDTPCNSIDQIVFDPDGNVRPCCGFNNENQGVVIGKLNTHGLRDLVKRMQNDPILQFLATNPMSSVFEHIERVKNLSGYSGACHLCQDAIGGLINKEELQAKLFDRQQFYPFWFTHL
jgi:hypothetical protein